MTRIDDARFRQYQTSQSLSRYVDPRRQTLQSAWCRAIHPTAPRRGHHSRVTRRFRLKFRGRVGGVGVGGRPQHRRRRLRSLHLRHHLYKVDVGFTKSPRSLPQKPCKEVVVVVVGGNLVIKESVLEEEEEDKDKNDDDGKRRCRGRGRGRRIMLGEEYLPHAPKETNALAVRLLDPLRDALAVPLPLLLRRRRHHHHDRHHHHPRVQVQLQVRSRIDPIPPCAPTRAQKWVMFPLPLAGEAESNNQPGMREGLASRAELYGSLPTSPSTPRHHSPSRGGGESEWECPASAVRDRDLARGSESSAEEDSEIQKTI